MKLKTRVLPSLKAIVEVLIKCQHLAAADVSTAPRTTINHFREIGIRNWEIFLIQHLLYQGSGDNFANHPCYMMF